MDTLEECGVKLAKTTVTYRFTQPEHAMLLVLTQSYAGAVPQLHQQN